MVIDNVATGQQPPSRDGFALALASDLLTLHRFRDVQFKQAGLRDLVCPPDPWEIMLLLFCAPAPMSLGEVCAELDYSPRLLGRWIDALAHKGLVARNGKDQRVLLTGFGASMIESALAPGGEADRSRTAA